MTRVMTLILGILIIAAGARASTVDLTLVNAGPGNNDGSYFVYPYNFSVNGSSSLVSLICNDFSDDINFGETWTANVYTMHDILGGSGQMNPTNGLVAAGQRNSAYEQSAWLFQQLVANPTGANSVSINHTIWGLFAATPYNSNSDVASWFAASSAATANLSAADAESLFYNVDFYTPVAGTQTPSWNGRPQELMGIDLTASRQPLAQTPEPASLILLGTGLLGLARTLRKKIGS